MRKYVVADVRGELTLLKKLFQKIGPNPDDTIVFTGSYLGPGLDSKGVVDFLIDAMRILPNLHLLRGCYEFYFEQVIETRPALEVQVLWAKMGGNRVFDSYSAKDKIVVAKPEIPNIKNVKELQPYGEGLQEMEVQMNIPASHIIAFGQMHQWYEDDTFPYVVTHCGGHPSIRTLNTPLDIIQGDRDWWLKEPLRVYGKEIIFSHVPFSKIYRQHGKFGLDLGAGFGGKLACFEMMEDKITTVD